MSDPFAGLRSLVPHDDPFRELRSIGSIGAWEPTESPNVQKRRKPDGTYEYRPNPAGREGAPGVEHKDSDNREQMIREAMSRTGERPKPLAAETMDQLAPRVAANIVSTPELPSMLSGLLDKASGRRPAPPGLSSAELLNPRTLYAEPARQVVEKVMERRGAAADRLAQGMTSAGFSPMASALTDAGLEIGATVLDPTNLLPGVEAGKALRAREALGAIPGASLSREMALAAQLPEAPPLASFPDLHPTLAKEAASADAYLARRGVEGPPAPHGPVDIPMPTSAGLGKLTPRIPRWATTHDEAIAGWDNFISSKRASAANKAYVAIDPEDVPFDLVNLPLVRFENPPIGVLDKVKDALDPADLFNFEKTRNGKFYMLGDQTLYARDSPGRGDTGGTISSSELYTPRSPLVLARGDKFDASVGGDNALVRSAERAGHDAVLIFNRSDSAGRVEVIKTALSGPGVPRRAPLYDFLARSPSNQYARAVISKASNESTYNAAVQEINDWWTKPTIGVFSKGGERRPPLKFPEYPGDEALAAIKADLANLDGTGTSNWKSLFGDSGELVVSNRGVPDGWMAGTRPDGTRVLKAPYDYATKFDDFARSKGFDPDRLSYYDEIDLREQMRSQGDLDLRPDIVPDIKAKKFRVGDREFDMAWQARAYRDGLSPETGAPLPELTRERWEQLKAGQSEATAARLKAARENVDKPILPPESPDAPRPRMGREVVEKYSGERAQIETQIQQAADTGMIPPEQVPELRAQHLKVLDAGWHEKVVQAAKATDDPTLAMLADETEAAVMPEVEAPPLIPGGIGPGGRFKPSEAGHIKIPHWAPPPTSPMDAVVRYGADPKLPFKQRMQKAADTWIDQMSNKEEAPVRLLKRAGLTDEANVMELYIGKKRGAARVAHNAVSKGVRLWDPVTQSSRRISDSFESIVGGLDGQSWRDLNDLMAAQHHLELVGRQERAALEFDMARGRRLQDMRQARRSDKESLRRMSGDIRSKRAAEVVAVRKAARAGGQANARLGAERALLGQADLVRERASRLRDEALIAAERSADTGFDQSRAEFVVASQYARRLLKEELRNSTRQARPGSTHGLTTGVPPRSPATIGQVDKAAAAMARAAEIMGVSEGQMRAFLASSRSMDSAGKALASAAGRQADNATNAFVREAGVDLLGAGRDVKSAITSAQRVAMGIRDEATNFRKRFPPVEKPPDASLGIDSEGTKIARDTLNQIEQRYGFEIDPATGGQRIAKLSDLANRVREWSNAATIEQLDSVGFLTPDRKAALLAKNAEYAPFFRLLDELADDPILTGGSTSNPIKKISGGLSPSKPIAPPLESFVAHAQRIAMWVEKQRVKNLLGDFAEAHADVLGNEIKKVSAANATDAFQVFRDGQRHLYSAPKDVLQAVDKLTPTQANIFMQAAVMAARTLRAGATLLPDFALRNFLRDQATAGVYGAEFHYRPFADFFTGLWAQTPMGGQLKQVVEEWEAAGGALSDYINLERPQVQLKAHAAAGLVQLPGGRLVRAPIVAKTIADWRAETNVFAKVMYPILKPMEAVGGAIEQATRIGAYRRAKISGATDLKAANFSRGITLDFGRSGSAVQRWNSVEAFANANIQDVARFSRAMRERPVATMLSAGAYVTIPALAVYWAHKDDPGYQGLPEFEKANFLQIEQRDDGRWVRIPRPQGLINLMFGYGVQKALEAATDKLGVHPVEELLSTVFNETPLRYSPVQPDAQEGGAHGSMEFIPTIGQPMAEVAAGESGYSSYRSGPIVPKGMVENELPENRALDSTTALARKIGQATGAAPLKIDYLIRGYGAGMATSLIRGGEILAGETGGLPELPATAKDIPGIGGLISSSPYGFGSQPTQDLYALEKTAVQAASDLKKAGERGQVAEYQRILREHPEALIVKDLSKAKDELSKLRDARKSFRTIEGMTPEARADALLQVDQSVSQISAGTMHWVTDWLRGLR